MTTPINEILINRKYIRNIKSLINHNSHSDHHDPETHSIPYIVNSIIKTEDFMRAFDKKLNIQSSILPNNCKFIDKRSNTFIYIIEEEPKLRTVSFNFDPTTELELLKQNGKYDLYGLKNFNKTVPFRLTLSIPYVTYILNFSSRGHFREMYLFFRLNPITSLDDYLLEPCLPNISAQEYRVCLGDIISNGYGGKQSFNSLDINNKIQKIIDSFWFNSFNYDYFEHCIKYSQLPELSDLFTYSYNSKKDPSFIFSVNWFNTGRTLNDIIEKIKKNNYDGKSDFESIFEFFQKTVEQDENEFEPEVRNLTESIILPNNFILSIGDELNVDDKKYFITSFKYTREDRTIVAEDDDNKIYQFKATQDFLNKISNQFKNKEVKELKIENIILKEGDFVQFSKTNEVKIVEKIIKTRDNINHIKIGRNFYLENCFQNGMIKIFNGIINFGGQDLKQNQEYIIMETPYSSEPLFSFWKATFKEYFSEDGNFILYFFSSENKQTRAFRYDTKAYTLDTVDKIKKPKGVFRINNYIIQTDEQSNIFYIEGKGCGIYAKDLTSRLMGRDLYYDYDEDESLKYFKEFCKRGDQELIIESFDKNISYKIGDNVIFIDWNIPEEMLKIKRISGFKMKEKIFNLELTDDSGHTSIVPLIDTSSGEGYFETIRHVCNQINDMKIGMKVQVNKKGIPDFLMKNVYEIKAFIIDYEHPLVLFSNGRTLYFNEFCRNFDIVDKKYKKFSQKPEEFNLKIKYQDGDMFKSNDDLFQIVYSTSYRKDFLYNLAPGHYNSFKIRTISPYWRSRIKDYSTRRGLLLPRNKKDNLQYTTGHPTLFSQICKGDVSFGIRRSYVEEDNIIEESRES